MRTYAQRPWRPAAAGAALAFALITPAAPAQTHRPTAPPHNEQGREPVLPTSPYDIGGGVLGAVPADPGRLLWAPPQNGFDLHAMPARDLLPGLDPLAAPLHAPVPLDAPRLIGADPSATGVVPATVPAPSSGAMLLLIAAAAAGRRRR